MRRSVAISAAILLLRIASGWVFWYHGSAILFGAFSGPGPKRFAASHHWPVAVAYLGGLAQVTGAVAILTGVLFRLGAAFVFIVMAGAIFLVHLPHGFDVSNNGIEYPLTQLVVATALALTGPGAYSLASWLPSWLQKC
jgi:putative oxidoreductase